MGDNNYINIQGWMINKLDLNFNEAGLFAIIYGFNQDGQSSFSGSQGYLCKMLKVTRPTLRKMLDKLIAKKLIIEHKKVVNNVTFNTYKISWGVVKKFTGVVKNFTGGSKESLQGGSKESLHNNTNIDNTNNNDSGSSLNSKQTKDEIIRNKSNKFLSIIKNCKTFGKYDSQTLNDFFLYWTETSINGTTLRYEKEKTFDVDRRLLRWKKNDYSKQPEQQVKQYSRFNG